MAEESDVNMTGAPSGQERVVLANDASNVAVAPDSEERAAKRLKMDSPAKLEESNAVEKIVDGPAKPEKSNAVEKTVPGEGLHDAPAKEGDAKKPEVIDSRDRRTGNAPIKKE
jgi:hypothetical protein